jgi:hypothetical protein
MSFNKEGALMLVCISAKKWNAYIRLRAHKALFTGITGPHYVEPSDTTTESVILNWLTLGSAYAACSSRKHAPDI